MPYLEKPAYLENPPLDELMHYGMPRRSGRYPWGSGEDPYQHGSGDFLARVQELRKQKITFTDEEGNTYSGDTAIAKVLGMSTGDFRTEYSLRLSEKKTLERRPDLMKKYLLIRSNLKGNIHKEEFKGYCLNPKNNA